MYHSAIELQAIADARQDELRNERWGSASTHGTPGFLASIRRGLGLALISAGEAIADRQPARPNADLAAAPARSTSRFAS